LTDLRTAPDVPGGVIFSIKKRTSCPACSGFFLVKGRLGFFIVSHLIDIFFKVRSLSKECTPADVSRFIMDFFTIPFNISWELAVSDE
jgi:hypothetical protein